VSVAVPDLILVRCMALFVAVVIALATAACHRSARIPATSPDADALRWLDQADVSADFRDHVERQHDTRFISVYALSFTGEFGVPETPKTQELTRKHASRHIAGTTDVITSLEQQRLLRKASEYAHTYNTLLLDYLRDHPDT
jgi:hypothetical protein